MRSADEEDVPITQVKMAGAEEVVGCKVVRVARIRHGDRMRNAIKGIVFRIVDGDVIHDLVVGLEFAVLKWIVCLDEHARAGLGISVSGEKLHRRVVAPTAPAGEEDLAGRQQDGMHGLHAKYLTDGGPIGGRNNGFPPSVETWVGITVNLRVW